MKGFFNYSEGETVLHNMNPLIKILLSLFICVSCFLSGSHMFITGIVSLDIAIAAAGGIGKRAVRMLVSLIKISTVLFLLQVFFIRDGNILLKLPLGIFITDKGLSFSFLMVLRLIGGTMPLAIMLSLTKMNDLANALVRLGIPYKYAFSLITAIRFIPVLITDMEAVMEAQKARGVEFDTKNIIKKIGLILPLCVPLLVSSVKRIEVSALSAELRGFHYREKNSGFKQYGVKITDAIALLLSTALMAAAVIM